MQSTVLHEFGHQIHQQFGLTVSNYRTPPLEQALKKLFRQRTVSPTRYADTNAQEWFAESFSLYTKGRLDVIDPSLVDLLQKMEKGVIKDADSLTKWLGSI